MCVNKGTPTMIFVSYTSNVDCMCDASYIKWKYRQYRIYHVIFARKYKTLQNVNIPGARFNSSGTPLFFYLCSVLMAIEQWGFFSVPHLMWYRASVYYGHLRGPVTITPIAERLEVLLSLPVFTTQVRRG